MFDRGIVSTELKNNRVMGV